MWNVAYKCKADSSCNNGYTLLSQTHAHTQTHPTSKYSSHISLT